ncbi:DUF4185 domain-containing protein [Streptomyces sp. URMC 123]|uniref:DUF4185 domain-containing protein n=1 Tax=Streptomyces sp. URMC 123 TaxID=3423403 RepID=UPI003F1D06EF
MAAWDPATTRTERARARRSVGPRPGRGPATATVLAVVLAVLAAVLLIALPGESPPAPGCESRRITSWAADRTTTAEFARYGDDGARADDWTGGDGTRSVRLPDGRTLWLFSDPFLGQVNAPPNPAGQPHRWRSGPGGSGPPAWLRNAAVLMSPSGRLERTLTGGAPGRPASLFPEPPGAPQQWRWPVHAVVEPRVPGAAEQVVRVLLWHRTAGAAHQPYGVPLGTEVATLSLPDLRVEGITAVGAPPGAGDPARRVQYGTAAVHDEDWTYVFGGDDGPSAVPPARSSSAYLARVPRGRLADPAAWQYWDGGDWRPDPARAAPVLGDGGRYGVGSSFTVLRDGRTWVLLTMDAGGPGAAGLATVASYWACSPHGPWHGPAEGFRPPQPPDSAPRPGTAAYNPQAHPALGGDGLLLSYDVNWLAGPAAVVEANANRNVELYRPRFVRLRLGPAG